MLSVIIPTEGVEQTAVATLAALVPGAAAGIIKEVLLVDGTSNGVIERVADVAGCRFIGYDGPSQGAALAAGALEARSPWLMFLPAGAVLETGWIEETTQFIQIVATSGRDRAAVTSGRGQQHRQLPRGRRDVLLDVADGPQAVAKHPPGAHVGLINLRAAQRLDGVPPQFGDLADGHSATLRRTAR